MSGKANALSAYSRVANAEVNPLQQIVMLYDGAVKFLHLAAADIDSGDLVAKAEHSNRVLDIIGYLQSILDFERGGEVAPALNLFYSSLMVDALQASARLDSALMRRIADLLIPVRDAWAEIARSPTPLGAASIEGAIPAERVEVRPVISQER